jgi:predicted porin
MKRNALHLAIAGAMTFPMAAQAVKYSLSGQVSRALIYMDDGEQSALRQTDNGVSGTRFRLRGSEDLGNGMQVGFYWELQTQSAAPANQRPDLNGEGDDPVFGGGDLRQANVFFSGKWGKLTLGQTDGAGNAGTEVDLSGTDLSGAYHGRTSFNGGMRWRTGSGGCITAAGAADPTCASAATAGTFFSEYDAFSRYDAIRYDSPALGPVTLSTSIGNDNKWEVAGRLSTGLAGGQLQAALFYGEATGDLNVDNRYGGSASYLFSQGTNITVAYAHNKTEAGLKSHVYSVKLGHKWGTNAISIGYGEADDVTTNGFQDTGWNVGFVHSLPKANTQLYASYLFQSLDAPAGTPSVEDMNAFIVGARVQFD